MGRKPSGEDNPQRGCGMKMRWACAMGHPVEADNEEELVRRAQDHMKNDHQQDVSREEVLRTAHRHE